MKHRAVERDDSKLTYSSVGSPLLIFPISRTLRARDIPSPKKLLSITYKKIFRYLLTFEDVGHTAKWPACYLIIITFKKSYTKGKDCIEIVQLAY